MLDEYQSVAGVVTIEDALVQIVGEIDDEHDPVTQPDITRVDDSTVEVSGRTLIDEINEVPRATRLFRCIHKTEPRYALDRCRKCYF